MRYLIPIAAPETLFPREEFHFPKPQIEIDGEPMIARVIDNLSRCGEPADFVFVTRAEDCRAFSLDRTLRLSTPGCTIVQLQRPAQGAACSALMAVDHIDDDQPLVIANGDQILDCDLAAVFEDFRARDLDAGVVVFESVHPRWSYVRVDEAGLVTEAAEKKVISRTAVAGLYYFRKGADFVACAHDMILNDRSVEGRFFIAPALNEAILRGLKVGVHTIPAEAYHSLYSPQRLELYERQIQDRRGRTAEVRHGLQVVIPMAGLGSRFADAGYAEPKPFIDVAGEPMIGRVMENLKVAGASYVLIARSETLRHPAAQAAALSSRGAIQQIVLEAPTEGAACTVLLARRALDPDAPLLIANCDQIIDFDCQAFIDDAQRRGLDGSILVFRDAARDPKWSFARLDAAGRVTEVAEKQPISDLATVGLYYFRRARDFADSAIDMIARNERVNGEFYVCPVYNQAIAQGLKIGVYAVPPEAMHGIGTPQDLKTYLALIGAG